MESKDLFSGHASLYASYRPTYPEALYEFILPLVEEKKFAWDCATGNGQVASRLALDFENVFATDISKQQIEEADPARNIIYSISKAEHTHFEDRSFDLITVGQAVHWFDTTAFFNEVKRVGKPGGVIALWGYSNIRIMPDVNEMISELYDHVVGSYWDEARRHVETAYADIPFPFETIETPLFHIQTQWSMEHLAGYLESWSATQRYIKHHQINPVTAVMEKIQKYVPSDLQFEVMFPVFVVAGRI